MFVSNIGAKHSVFVFGRLTSQARQRQSRLLCIHNSPCLLGNMVRTTKTTRSTEADTRSFGGREKRSGTCPGTYPPSDGKYALEQHFRQNMWRPRTASPDSEPSGGRERKREGRPRGSEAEEAVLSRFSFLYSPSLLLLLLLLSSGGGGGKKKVFKEKREEICMRGERGEGKK